LPALDNPVRARILSAAFAAFKELGYSQASTLEIATRAKVSKRELYAQFGNKQQMLVTCIAERSQAMRLPDDWPELKDRADLEGALTAFGEVLLREISDPDVIAVFRFAIAEADRSNEAAQALDTYGRRAARDAMRALLEQAQAAKLLDDTDLARMGGQFMSLLLGDVVMSLALGLAQRPSAAEIRQRARNATDAFLQLHPAREPGTPTARVRPAR
jgi:AcrR family transcriptional regulator